MTFADRLRELRKTAGLSCEELSRKSGLTAIAIYNYEKGKTSPSLISLQKLVKGLNVPLGVFSDCTAPKDFRSKTVGA